MVKLAFFEPKLTNPNGVFRTMTKSFRLTLSALLLLVTACSNDIPDPEPDNWEGRNPGECTDGADNDGDGDFDCDDSDCAGSPDCAQRFQPGWTVVRNPYIFRSFETR